MYRNYWPTLDWQSVDSAPNDIQFGKFPGLEAEIQSGYGNVNGIVVAVHGYIAYEKYFNGFCRDDAHHVASVTKSILSALVGIAIDAGYIKSVDQKVVDFFPDYEFDAGDAMKQDISLRHLLSMTAPYAFAEGQEPLDRMCMQNDWVGYALGMLGKNGNIGTFKYSTAGAHLLSAIITRSTGKCAREFANERLFKPIGMKEIPDHEMASFGFDDLFGERLRGWVKDPAGNSTGGWGLMLTPRDMARFGFLYLNRGEWAHGQIVSSRWVDESTSSHSSVAIGSSRAEYGFLWWLREECGLRSYLALGDGGNVICCIPDKELVVAIASGFVTHPRDRWSLIKECILPALMGGPLAKSRE